ncbi:MAG TPA: AAA family ATPase, partial [Thermomicrobiales bacterium]
MGDVPHGDRPYVFVSYASGDRARALPVAEALERAGIRVWIDREGIHGGANYGEEIAEAIKGAVALVLMASAASLASRNVKQEIALAWDFERPYLPLLLEPVTIPTDVRYWLTAAQWIEVLDTPAAQWLPAVLTALAPLGIAPSLPQQEDVRLAGRERELALLREKLTAAKEGKGGLVLIGGEAGIGKTTLAEAALHDAARAGCVVLEGHCFDLAETPPYGPWIDLFARYQPLPLSPALPAAFAARGTVGAVPSQIALFVQVQDFLAVLGRQQPVVLLLDDLHWSDPASLDLLRFLSRSVATLPLLVLVTYRSDELTRKHPLYALLPQLAREASAARIDLGRLADPAVHSLVEGRYDLLDADAARLVAYLQGRAEGNALFVGELLRALEEGSVLMRDGDGWHLGDLTRAGVPVLLQQVIEGRVARLADAEQEALGAAAVIGQEVPFAVWATVGGMDEDSLTETVERATAARLMEEMADGTGARFIHALIREALYEGILPSRRRRLHRAVGEAMAALPDPDADAVAHHFATAGDARAAEWLVTAGERAHRAYAWLTAADRFEAALAAMDRGDGTATERGWLLYRLAFLRRYQAPRQALQYVEEAAQLAALTTDRLLAAHAMFYTGYLHITTG